MGMLGTKKDAGSGFTLVELILVLTIVAVLAVAAVIGFDVSGADTDAVAIALRSNLQLAQDLAMTQGSPYGFRSIDASNYEIFEGAPGSPARDPLTASDFLVAISPVVFAGVTPIITFDSTGVPDIAADAPIVITHLGVTRTVTVTAETGFVTLSSP
jgi:prepilin-type N-terminal cleavage/methylation domain-containing protein